MELWDCFYLDCMDIDKICRWYVMLQKGYQYGTNINIIKNIIKDEQLI